MMAARLKDVSAPLKLGFYDERKQLTMGSDGQPLVMGLQGALKTLTEASSDPGDPASPPSALNSGSAARTDPPDPVEPPMALGTLTKASGDPTDTQSGCYEAGLETATRAGADTDDPPQPKLREGFSGDDLATGIVAF